MIRPRFALLCDGASLDAWHLDALAQLAEHADLAGLIIVAGARAARDANASRLLRRYVQRVLGRSRRDIAGSFSGIPHIDVEDVGQESLDFVLCLGVPPVARAAAARHGLWYFSHESDGELLPFVPEVLEALDVTYAALMRIGTDDSTASVLEDAFFRTDKRSYAASKDYVLDRAAAWPARTCERMVRGVVEERPAVRHASTRGRGGRLRLSGLYRATVKRRLALAWERLFRHPQWNIGMVRLSPAELLAGGAYADAEIEWFPLGRRHGFLADPFALEQDGSLRILCEYFDYADVRGRISFVDYSPGRGFAPEIGTALASPVHMSYPFIIEHEGDVYCVPETAVANEVALFRATAFPDQWSKVAVLLDNVAAVDATLFEHDGRWWLLCGRQGPYEDVELWAWHAADLMGPWTPHARNPVKSDVRGSRPGGLPFVHDGKLYRPAQDCSRTYGWRTTIQQVVRLTPTEFHEEPVVVLQTARTSPFSCGPHTVTLFGGGVLVDGRRSVFSWFALRAFLRIWLGGARRRLPRRS